MVNTLLYVMIGLAAVVAVAHQRLATSKQTGPVGAMAVATFGRLLLLTGWCWFAFLSGYWQIAVLILVGLVINYTGLIAKKTATEAP